MSGGRGQAVRGEPHLSLRDPGEPWEAGVLPQWNRTFPPRPPSRVWVGCVSHVSMPTCLYAGLCLPGRVRHCALCTSGLVSVCVSVLGPGVSAGTPVSVSHCGL